MVDRITPLTVSEHITLLEEDYGIEDKWPVVAEDFKQWVIGYKMSAGKLAIPEVPPPSGRGVCRLSKPWEADISRYIDTCREYYCEGPQYCNDEEGNFCREVQSYEEMKLKLLNAGHSCVAYLATLLGYRFVDEAVRDVRVSGFLRSFMDEVTPCLEDLKVDVERYKEKIVERFSNAFVKDDLQRVAQDGSSKFYSTTRSAVLELVVRKKNIVKLSVALAAWIMYFTTDEVNGVPIVPSDPKTPVLRGFAQMAVERPFDLRPVGMFLDVVYGLPDAPALILTRWVTMSLAALQQCGIAETLDAGGPLEALLAECFTKEEGWNSFVSFTTGDPSYQRDSLVYF